MRKVPLHFFFLLALFALLFGTVFFPSIRLAPLPPLLAIGYYRLTYPKALWLSFACGLLLDLLSSSHFGLTALSFTAASAVLYFQKRHFFEDKPVAFSLFASVISACITLTHLFALYLFDKAIPLTGKSFLTEIIAMPALDGVFAFLWFTCPMRLYTYIQKVGIKGLFKRKEEDEAESQ